MSKRQTLSTSDFFKKIRKNEQDNDNQYDIDDPDVPNNAVNNEPIANNSCQPIEFTNNDEPPECWDSKQAKYFCEVYSWLYFKNKKLGCNICNKININLKKNPHSHVSLNWIKCNIVPSGNSISKQQATLRKKISKHKCSQSYISLENIIHQSKLETMDLQIIKNSKLEYESTEKIFRTTYFIAKNQRPFLDMPKLIDLQTLNGVYMDRVLQTNKSCANIVDHIAYYILSNIE